jgi:antitoxin ParD1/3/4
MNISLPPKMATLVKTAVKKGDYMSTSEFFRELLRDWQKGKLLNESKKEIVHKKGKVLNSLKNLR